MELFAVATNYRSSSVLIWLGVRNKHTNLNHWCLKLPSCNCDDLILLQLVNIYMGDCVYVRRRTVVGERNPDFSICTKCQHTLYKKASTKAL